MGRQSEPVTVWKFQDFSITQILRESNFGESRSSKNAIFGTLTFVNLVDFNIQKVQKFIEMTILSIEM